MIRHYIYDYTESWQMAILRDPPMEMSLTVWLFAVPLVSLYACLQSNTFNCPYAALLINDTVVVAHYPTSECVQSGWMHLGN